MMNKKECEKAVEEICELCKEKHEVLYGYKGLACAFRAFDNTDCDKVRVFKQLIKEHFDPQPYTFRELNKGMWIWDDKENRADKIFETFEADFGVPYIKFDGAFEEMRTIVEFEVNRFFPLTKAM